ncbi:MAG: helix-turn-helix domain-containing protein [Clostridia bacterium]|nr:helix-turn-helix domain-containing protein [Clostridia bacterium]
MDNIGSKIQQLRKTKGYTQEQLAELAGVSRQTIYKWEAGLVQPNSDNIAKLCEIFLVDRNYFYGITTDTVKEKQPKGKKRLAILIILAAITLVLFAVTLCFGLITYQPTQSAMWVSTSKLNSAWFYVFLSVTLLFVCITAAYAVRIFAFKKK